MRAPNRIALEEHFLIPAFVGLASLPMLRLGPYVYPARRETVRKIAVAAAH